MEPGDAPRRLVGELVDEHDRSIQGEECNDDTKRLEGIVQRQERTRRKRCVKTGYRGEEVDPIEGGSRSHQVAKRLPQLPDWQLVLGGPGLLPRRSRHPESSLSFRTGHRRV